jgi:hypothetical protein
LGETKISLTMSPERSLGQHWPSVVLGLLDAGQPQDTLTGGIAAVLAGTAYGIIGRATFIWCAAAMLLFIAIGSWLAKDSLHITGAAIDA